MSRIQLSKLYRRLIASPKYKRTGGVYLHEDWMVVIMRRARSMRSRRAFFPASQ